MTSTTYFDTSALAKWYLNEAFSQEVEVLIQQEEGVGVSSLTVVEMRCLLARRVRNRDIDMLLEKKILAAFREDVRKRFLQIYPFEDQVFAAATNLIDQLADHALRTLDALHLALAREYSFTSLATADSTMADAARSLRMDVRFFG